ncbi:DUF3304 domain-containing protein, partial [Corallococcus exiguus]|nr:DUF3304 domain-containing protein [Corallococcus exiguus]
HQRDGSGASGLAAIGHAPGQAGRQRTGCTDQPEQADGGIAVGVRWLRQQERERGPENREHGKAAGAQQGALAQHRLLHEQHADRAQQGEIAQAGAVVESRQAALQCQCGQHQGAGSDGIHQAPVTQAGKQAGHGTR